MQRRLVPVIGNEAERARQRALDSVYAPSGGAVERTPIGELLLIEKLGDVRGHSRLLVLPELLEVHDNPDEANGAKRDQEVEEEREERQCSAIHSYWCLKN